MLLEIRPSGGEPAMDHRFRDAVPTLPDPFGDTFSRGSRIRQFQEI
jgi:hypothetical protein